MVEVRRFAPHELVDYIRTHKHAGTWRDDPVKAEDAAWIDADSAWGAFVNGHPVSVLRNIPLRQSVRGTVKAMGGIAGVATVPPYRRQGHARALMNAALSAMAAQGQAVSTLYPIKESFYAAFGYVSGNGNLQVDVPAASLPGQRAPAPDWSIDLAPHAERREAVSAFRDSAIAPWVNGYVSDPDRPEALWQAHSRHKLAVFLARQGETQAWARYWFDGDTLCLDEVHWTNPAAGRNLLAYFALYRDQVATLRFRHLPLGTNIHGWLRDLPGSVPATITPAPMLRVVAPIKALTGLSANAAGSLVFALRDEQCPWNEGSYRIEAEDGTLVAQESAEEPAFALSIQGLTALVYGLSSTDELAERAWIGDIDTSTRALLSAWFPQRHLFNPYTF